MSSTVNPSNASEPAVWLSDSRRRRALDACKALVREIARRRLQRGDMLPPQDELRKQLGISNRPISEAMRVLQDEGVLSRKPRVGTVIQDPTRIPRGVFSVGLAVPRLESTYTGPGHAVLTGLIQEQLARFGCQVYVYRHLQSMFLQEPRDPMNSFAGLVRAVEHRRIDALISTYTIDTDVCEHWLGQGIVIAQITSRIDAPLTVHHESAAIIDQALGFIKQHRCKRPALVSSGAPAYEFKGDVWARQYITPFMEAVGRTDYQSLYFSHIKGMYGAEDVAEQLYDQPAHQRPDGLVILEDSLAMGLTAVIANRGRYRPKIAVITPKQVPTAFALPVVRLELDIARQARELVQLTMDALRDPSIIPERRRIQPRPLDMTERCIPEPGADAPVATEHAIQQLRERLSLSFNSPDVHDPSNIQSHHEERS